MVVSERRPHRVNPTIRSGGEVGIVRVPIPSLPTTTGLSCRASFMMLRVAVTSEWRPHSTCTRSMMSRLYHRLSFGKPAHGGAMIRARGGGRLLSHLQLWACPFR